MLSIDEVRFAYFFLLGREPETDEVVETLRFTVTSLEELRNIFINSDEFRAQFFTSSLQNSLIRSRHPFNLPSIPVEVSVSGNVLAQMFERIHQEWEYLGEIDPYWSVVTRPQYHIDNFASHKEQFYLSGKISCDLFLASLRRNNVNPNSIDLCLEVGCGVGRVTNFLAKSLTSVLATDISVHHLDLAREHLKQEGLENVELKHLSSIHTIDDLPIVDAIFSVITLQHNPPPVMACMLRALLGRLKPNGIAYLQIPTYRNGYLFEVDRYLNSVAPKTLEMHFLPQYEIFKIIDASGSRCLEVREDGMVGDEEKMLSNTFLIQKNAASVS